jgi:hypothetical protein
MNLRTCTTCKHHQLSKTGHGHLCRKSSSVDPVTGEVELRPCGVQRALPGMLAVISAHCGTSGRWWEPVAP